jgi:hypothetical protein
MHQRNPKRSIKEHFPMVLSKNHYVSEEPFEFQIVPDPFIS